MQNGVSPQDVIDELIAGDEDRDFRQVAVIDAQGRGAAYTGAFNINHRITVITSGPIISAASLEILLLSTKSQNLESWSGSISMRLIRGTPWL